MKKRPGATFNNVFILKKYIKYNINIKEKTDLMGGFGSTSKSAQPIQPYLREFPETARRLKGDCPAILDFRTLAKIIKKAYRLGTYYILNYTLFSNLNY